MQFIVNNYWLKRSKIFYFLCLLPLLAQAEIIKIAPKTLITKNTTYKNVQLDLSQGSFIVKQHASLTIENCIIKGTVSPQNPFLIHVEQGRLRLIKNKVYVTSKKIVPRPYSTPIYNTLVFSKASAEISDNYFSIDKRYTVGLLITYLVPLEANDQFIIRHNRIKKFHGGFLIRNKTNTLVTDNQFFQVSNGNIFILEGDNASIYNNTILFPGYGYVGDGIDIFASEHVRVKENYISSGFCYGILILRSKDIQIEENIITSGITYAIGIASTLVPQTLENKMQIPAYILALQTTSGSYTSHNININHNYFAKNRFGLTSEGVDGLEVYANVFIQSFRDAQSRVFWTNNDVLFQATINMNWHDNYYKEAYAQDNESSAKVMKLVEFPAHGGVKL
jgi:parallel beta-helix repeat protein